MDEKWAAQHVQEQQGLLEILFLLYYNVDVECSPTQFLDIARFFNVSFVVTLNDFCSSLIILE
jgi:hypothetical protein